MATAVLATCQFQVQKNSKDNLRCVLGQIERAVAKGAHIVHFSEACLSGYLGVEVPNHESTDWNRIMVAMEEIMAAAKRHRVCVVVGCNHRLTGKHKPHNSLYVIDSRGKLVTRYDKMFCTGSNSAEGDLLHYTPGADLVTFRVRGITCGLLICHDFRYPELFRAYKQQGVELMLVSFHNAGMTKANYDKYLATVPATLQAAAASNYFTVSATNGTRKYAWPSFVVSAEGLVVSKASAHRSAILINKIDTKKKLYDASAAWRGRCMRGIFHSGTLVRDDRSRKRNML